MYLTSEIKKGFAKTHGKSDKDTGSAEVQIALFTHRINHLTGHLQRLKKDAATQRSLLGGGIFLQALQVARKVIDAVREKSYLHFGRTGVFIRLAVRFCKTLFNFGC